MSANEKQKVVEVLKELNEFVHDGLEGYERAAEESKDQLRKDIYRKFSQQRLAFANELNMIIQKYGGSPERGTTNKGKLYRQWMDFKAALTGNNEEAILGSNIYGEEWAQKAYRDALDHDLPAEVRGTILRQREASTDVLDRLHQLREGSTGSNAPTGTATRSANATGSYITFSTALYVAGAAAAAALVYGLFTKKIPTSGLASGVNRVKGMVPKFGTGSSNGSTGSNGASASGNNNTTNEASGSSASTAPKKKVSIKKNSSK